MNTLDRPLGLELVSVTFDILPGLKAGDSY